MKILNIPNLHFRSEVSDENGNVRGTYTIPDTEGNPILVSLICYLIITWAGSR